MMTYGEMLMRGTVTLFINVMIEKYPEAVTRALDLVCIISSGGKMALAIQPCVHCRSKALPQCWADQALRSKIEEC